ncbi:hypothetical protein D1012_03850 [Pseudotabrizicola alkalilacus]|uniref:Uncharacterized protein n=1 Tax=Pseudotabrizicola alkalilacus TaxID=2305252 RepID=A0A411Z888_9RHOB|nr:hypothetical protein D1012_03850 [Pseudotabrizicola alkalilacus]
MQRIQQSGRIAEQHNRPLFAPDGTRKSSEEGLEQEFNSLHAQREACERKSDDAGRHARSGAGVCGSRHHTPYGVSLCRG